MSSRKKPALASLVLPEDEQASWKVENDGELVMGKLHIGAAGMSVAASKKSANSASSASASAASSNKDSKDSELEKLQNEIKLDEFELLEKLGEGNSSVVHKAWHPAMKKFMAVKKINIFDRARRHQIVKELHTLYHAECENLIKFYGAFFKEGSISIALELMDAGSLSDVLLVMPDKKIPEPELAHIASQILSGLAYLRANHKIHRDIKPANICLNHSFTAKLSDFGITTQIEDTIAGASSFVGCLEENEMILLANGKSMRIGDLNEHESSTDSASNSWPALLDENGLSQSIKKIYRGSSPYLYEIHSTPYNYCQSYRATGNHELSLIFCGRNQYEYNRNSKLFNIKYMDSLYQYHYMKNIPLESENLLYSNQFQLELINQLNQYHNNNNNSKVLHYGDKIKIQIELFLKLELSIQSLFQPQLLELNTNNSNNNKNDINSNNNIIEQIQFPLIQLNSNNNVNSSLISSIPPIPISIITNIMQQLDSSFSPSSSFFSSINERIQIFPSVSNHSSSSSPSHFTHLILHTDSNSTISSISPIIREFTQFALTDSTSCILMIQFPFNESDDHHDNNNNVSNTNCSLFSQFLLLLSQFLQSQSIYEFPHIFLSGSILNHYYHQIISNNSNSNLNSSISISPFSYSLIPSFHYSMDLLKLFQLLYSHININMNMNINYSNSLELPNSFKYLLRKYYFNSFNSSPILLFTEDSSDVIPLNTAAEVAVDIVPAIQCRKVYPSDSAREFTWVGIIVDDPRHNIVLADGSVTGNTSLYMSPERIMGGKYGYSSDIWSFALTILESAMGCYPFPITDNYLEMMTTLVNGPPPTLPKNSGYSKELADFLSLCFVKESDKRATADELLSHPWIKKYSIIRSKSEIESWFEPYVRLVQRRQIKRDDEENSLVAALQATQLKDNTLQKTLPREN